MASSKEDEWLTLTQAMAYLKIGRTQLYSYMRHGDLPYRELMSPTGKRRKVNRRVLRSDLEKLLHEGEPEESDA